MRIPFIESSKEKGVVSALFDIGSGSVGAAIVIAQPDSPTRILFNTRVSLSNEEREEAQLRTALATILRDAGTAILDQYSKSVLSTKHGPVKQVYVTVHAPWVQSVTEDSHVTFTTPTHVTTETIKKVGQEGAKDKKEITSAHTVFERTVMRVELNGYPTALPVGKVASTIRVILMESSIVSAFQKDITQALATVLPGRTPIFNSAMYTYSTVVRELAEHSSSYTFLDIASEASACSVVKSGSIAQQGTVPAGTRTLIRSVKGVAAQSADSIYSMIRMIAEGTCSDAACEEIANTLSAAEPTFMRSFGEVFSTMIANSRLPNTLIISVHPMIAVWAEHFFERIDFSQFTLTGKPFEVQVLSSRILTDLALFGKDASAADTGIAVVSAFVHIRYT
jgi:hypothetical protein